MAFLAPLAFLAQTNTFEKTGAKKKASAVAGKLSLLFRGPSWSQGLKRFEIRSRPSAAGCKPRAGVKASYFFDLVVFFFFDELFLLEAFFAMALLPPFYV
ncbi:MAG TPA: hypothetical protein VFW23_06215 [Tepidisphaeraceae bacterium]|nr:hypothetical protein [Tepidisphaeraceae bacterium]